MGSFFFVWKLHGSTEFVVRAVALLSAGRSEKKSSRMIVNPTSSACMETTRAWVPRNGQWVPVEDHVDSQLGDHRLDNWAERAVCQFHPVISPATSVKPDQSRLVVSVADLFHPQLIETPIRQRAHRTSDSRDQCPLTHCSWGVRCGCERNKRDVRVQRNGKGRQRLLD